MLDRIRRARPALLSARLVLASVCTAGAMGVVCTVAVSSLENAATAARVSVDRQLSLIDDAVGMRAFTYQRGFVTQYVLTGDRRWLTEPDTARPTFEHWLTRANAAAESPESRRLLERIGAEYRAFNDEGLEAISLYDSGRLEEAKQRLTARATHSRNARAMFDDLAAGARKDAERHLSEQEGIFRRLVFVLVGTTILGAFASLLLGFLWSRRVTKPIYELQVQIQSAAERTRIQVTPGTEGVEAIGVQVGALVQRLEATDAALAEHRRNLIQSEKLSAVGELAAKLAHEVLNPLAGMKAAVQLLARQGARQLSPEDVLSTAEALNHQITRVEGLVRRLVNYSRPLAPRLEVISVGALLDAAQEASQTVLERCGTAIDRRDGADLPRVEVDPLLVTQALSNLIVNAAQATAAAGRTDGVELGADRAHVHGREQIVIRVADRGAGLPDTHLRELFKPFFTTKPEGHGLGLAVSQNVVLEHGGRISARNRPPEQGTGAVFEIQLPVAPQTAAASR
jgi:signal transduction histidine kinase